MSKADVQGKYLIRKAIFSHKTNNVTDEKNKHTTMYNLKVITD
jgi:hypothetical protein